MSAAERRKGATGEREVAAMFRAHGFDCDRTPNSGGLRLRGDLYGNVPLHIESKRQEVWRVPLWIAQAEADAIIYGPPNAQGIRAATGSKPWLLAMRRSGSPWYGLMRLDELARLLKDATL